MKDFETSYRTLMDAVDFDDALRTRILQEAETAEDASRSADSAKTISRRRFVGYGIAAAAALAAIGIAATGAPAQIVEQLIGGATSTNADNWFSLKAYADEPDAPANETRELDVESLTPAVHQGGYSYGMSSAEYVFDFSIAGSNIASVTYAIDGGRIPSFEDFTDSDGVTWEYVAFRQTIVVLNSEASRRAKEGNEQGDFSSFTVDYDDQGSHNGTHEDPLRRTIYIRFRTPEKATELFAACDAAPDGSDEEYSLGREANFVCGCEAARRLGEAPLSVTATFTDGTTQTKRYRIAPIDGFEERFREWFEHNEPVGSPDNPLFTITEIAETA